MRYIWRTGDLRHERVMHIEACSRTGEGSMTALCGREPAGGFNRSINAPFALGRPLCKVCLRAEWVGP